MAIDVEKEAEKIAESFVRIRTTGTTIEGAAAVHAAEVEICGSNIIDLVTRVVAEAKRDTVEKACCMAVCSNGCNQRIRAAFAATEPKIVHGLTCNKAPHTRDGYLHGEDYDGPYDVDGLEYCGRCHVVMPSPATEPRDIGKEIVTDLTAMCKEQDRSRPQQERFEKWCEDTLKDACLDQVFMSTDGVPPNPYDDERTKVLYACWLAAQSSDARQRFDKAAVELAEMSDCRFGQRGSEKFPPPPDCDCVSCTILDAARELGIGAA